MNNGTGFNYPKFANQLRGYSKQQVDMFVEDIADAYTELENENNNLRTRLAKAEAAVEKYRQTIDSCERMTENARSDADKLRIDAKSEADRLISDARSKSDAMLGEANEKSAALMDDARHESERLRDFAAEIAADTERSARENADKITAEATRASDEMNARCTDACRRIISETLVKVASECEVMDVLRRAVADYSAILCDVYKDQLRHIAELASRAAELPAIGRETYENMENLGRIFGIDTKLPDSLGVSDDAVKNEAEVTHETQPADMTEADVVNEAAQTDASDETYDDDAGHAATADEPDVTDVTDTSDDAPQSADKSNDDFYTDDSSAADGDDALSDNSVAKVYGSDDSFISNVITGGADIVRDADFSGDGADDAAVPDEVARAAAEELDNEMPLPYFFRQEVKMKNRPMLKTKHRRKRNLFEDD